MSFTLRSLASVYLLAFLLPFSYGKEPEISLQWAICDTDAATVLHKLNYADKEPYKSNPIVYYDTWPPQYAPQGIGLRTKVKKHDPGYPISMIKARFGDYNENVPSAADCVWNRYGNVTSYTCGLMNVLSEIGGAHGEDVWSEEQVAFVQRYQDVEWRELVLFGPYLNPKWKIHVLGMKAVLDDVQALPLHLMEIEIGVKKSRGKEIYDRVNEVLEEAGVVLCEKQLPKTLRLLEYLEDQDAATRVKNDRGSGQIVIT